MREVLDAGTEVGRIKRIMSVFSFHMTEEAFARNVRVNSLLEPAGCLGDLGWYCIRFALWTMRWQLPREVTGRILSERGSDPSPAPVPTDFSGELVFDGQASAGFYSSFIAQFQQWVNVGGNKGFLHVRDFVHPVGEHEPSFQVNQKEVRVGPAPAADRHAGGSALSQQALMMRNFADQVRSGELNTEWPEMALKTQQVLDACLASARDGSRAVAVEATGRRAETMSRDAPASTP
jgi:predicted dehydrogenase